MTWVHMAVLTAIAAVFAFAGAFLPIWFVNHLECQRTGKRRDGE